MLRRSRRSTARTAEVPPQLQNEMVEGGYEMFQDKDNIIESGDNSLMPQPTDSDALFRTKKLALLEKMVPHGLVPASTANAMLILGSKLDPEDGCFFPLPAYLIVAGSISLSLVFIPVLARHLLELILADKMVTRGEQRIITAIHYLGAFLGFVEVLLIFVGSVILYPHIGEITFDKKADEPVPPKYCDYAAVTFLQIFLTMSWIFIIIGFLCFIYIKCSEMRKKKKAASAVKDSHGKPH